MSLYDIFLQRAAQEHQNELNSDTGGIILASLAQGVMQGVQQEQARVQEEKDSNRKFDKEIENFTKIKSRFGNDYDVSFEGGKTKIDSKKMPIAIGEPPSGFIKNPNYGFNDKEAPFVQEYSPSEQNAKDKRLERVVQTIESNKPVIGRIGDAIKAIDEVDSGAFANWIRGGKKIIGMNDPNLGKYNLIKSVLTDTQLQYTARTKGAISDREMDLFRDASANDDLWAKPELKQSLKRLMIFVKSQNKSEAISYRNLYKDLPSEYSADLDTPEFATSEEAEAAGLEDGTIVIIDGQKFKYQK